MLKLELGKYLNFICIDQLKFRLKSYKKATIQNMNKKQKIEYTLIRFK